jgi:hypothetical protein
VPQQLHWRDLTGGIIAAAVLILVTLAVLLFARVGALHGKKVTLYVATDDASGVLAGTEVWLSGEKEGLVTDVTFQSASVDTMERVLITTEVLSKALPSVRRDSYAQIRPGANFIGVPVIYISPGTVGSRQLHEGDTIHSRAKPAIVDIAEGVSSIRPEVAALGAAGKELAAKLNRPLGTIGNARAYGFEDFADVSAGVSSLNARATRGRGTIAMAMRGGLTARASRTMAAADSIHKLVGSSRGSLGRFRRDTTLVTRAQHVLASLDTLRSLALSPVGTLAAIHSDSVLAHQLDREHVLLAELIKDMKANPLRYIRF